MNINNLEFGNIKLDEKPYGDILCLRFEISFNMKPLYDNFNKYFNVLRNMIEVNN